MEEEMGGTVTGDKKQTEDGRSVEILTLRIDSELMEQIKAKAKTLDTDVLTYAHWCLQTGLFLEDGNVFVRSKMVDEGDS